MRRLALIATAAAAVAAVPAAGASIHARSSLSASSLRVVYGGGVTLSGRVSTHRPGVRVAILSRAFNRSGTGLLARTTSGRGGRWTYRVRPSIATTYQASVAGLTSRPLTVGVRPALSVRMTRGGALVVHAAGGRSFAGRFVQLQRRLSDGRWTSALKHPLDRRSTAVFPAVELPRGTPVLRPAMSVNQAGTGFLGSIGAPFRLPARWVSLSVPRFAVDYGQSLRLSGRVSTGQASLPIAILARPFTQAEFQRVAIVRTKAGGSWSYRVRVPYTTAYQARWANAASRTLTVGVHPSISVRILSGARVWAHVSLDKPLAGRTIQIQRRTRSGRWHTVARLPLNRRATATFPAKMLPGGTSTLRAAISVNQAGAGYLGGFGTRFVYQR